MSEWWNALRMLRLEAPWAALLLLPLLVGLVVACRRRPPSLLVSDLRAFRAAIPGSRRRLTPLHLPLVLKGLGLIFLVIALVRPQWGTEITHQQTEGVDIILALDVSGSMEVIDVPEAPQLSRGQLQRRLANGDYRSRITIAKEEVKRFVEGRPNDRIGLVAFAANAYTACPPTLDHSFLLAHVERLEAGMLQDQSTGIAAPVSTATMRLRNSRAKRRVLVLFTDGANNVQAKITPRQAAKLAAMFNVVIYTVGMGSEWGFIVRRFLSHLIPEQVPDSIDHKLLADLAAATGGRAFMAEDAAGLAAAMQEIDALEKVSIEQTLYIDYRDLFPGWLSAGCLLLLMAFALEQTLFLKVP